MPTSIAPPPENAHVSHRVGFWTVAGAFLLVMAYSTVPTPLYPIYQQADGFPVATLTVIFAAYAVGVVLSLFFVGHISDWAGRRRMLVVALLVSAISAVLFMLSASVPELIAARVVNGVGIGILTATATAHLGELRARARPDENSIVASSVAGAANIGGLALGSLLGGAFAEYAPDPLVLPHTVFLVLFLVVGIIVVAVPETVSPPARRRRYRPQRIAAPPQDRRAFVAAAFAAFSAFAVFGLFTSLAPSILVGTFGAHDHLLAGSTTFAVFGAAALAQVLFRGVQARTRVTIAAYLCTAGLLLIGIGALLPSLAAFLVGGILAGAGVGVLFSAAVARAASLSERSRRGETLALIFLVAYCGLALPAVAVGLVLIVVPQTVVLVGFAAVVLVAIVGAAVAMRTGERRGPVTSRPNAAVDVP